MTPSNWIAIAGIVLVQVVGFGGLLFRMNLSIQLIKREVEKIDEQSEKRDSRTSRIEDMFHTLNVQVASGFAELKALLKEKHP